MIVAVASGKGGTGKTTIAVNLALVRSARIQFLDCDVEAPNAHLLLHPDISAREPVALTVPVLERTRCSGCGRCVEICAYNALALVGSELLVFEELCHGCGGCSYFCPEKALTAGRREIGVIERGRAGEMPFAQGRLNPGEALAPPVIAALRREAGPRPDTIIDCPPGTSCPVIQAVRGVDFCLVVTEPTPFGRHDLEAVADVLRVLGVPHGVVINRADLGDGEVDDFCRERCIPLLGRIPFDRGIVRSFAKGIPVVDERPEWKNTFLAVWRAVEGVLDRA